MFYKLCVMGNPIEHSLSPWIHQQFARQFSLAISYDKIKPEPDNLLASIEKFRQEQGFGFNVTHPFKQRVFKLIKQSSERADIAKSVNTITFNNDGSMRGDNTDGLGFIHDLSHNYQYSLKNRRILIVGAGGAVRGILHPLLLQKPAAVMLVNRTFANAEQLCREFANAGNLHACRMEELENSSLDVLIDGTPAGHPISLPASVTFSADSLFYDLKYIKPFSLLEDRETSRFGLLADGLGMLVEQAAESFYIWTQQKPDTRSVLTLLRKNIS